VSPTRSARPCSYPGCNELVYHGSRCGAHVETYHNQDWRAWYQTPEWKRIRAAQLLKEPWCIECKKEGRMTVATDVDHIERHQGDKQKFFNGPFQSLCHSHHSSKTIREVM
jgi:5-methylcytosine-specific restriction protein A